MKKLFLLLAGTTFVMSANAQELHPSIVSIGGLQQKQTIAAKSPINANFKGHGHASAAKTTTTGGSRWYSYSDYLAATAGGTAFSAPYIWNDTSSKDAYTGAAGTEYDYNNFVSVGATLDPFFAGFNVVDNYPGEIEITPTTPYTIDSISVEGIYYRSTDPAKAGVIDTLRIGVVYGDGTSTSDLPAFEFNDGGVPTAFPKPQYGVDTLTFIDMLHDSLHNRAGIATVHFINIPLLATDTAGDFFHTYGLTTVLNVPAGNFAAASVSFISGDATFTHGDTVFLDGGTYKYGMFRPLVEFVGTTSGASFPTYSLLDQNEGMFKQEGASDAGWVGDYVPNWAWSSTGGTASDLQYPVINFHVNCATCSLLDVANVKNTISGVKAFPNPANNVLTISYNLAKTSNVTVVLTNTMGQVVATQTFNNSAIGNATINTSALPAGVYAYSVLAGNDRSTGNVVIAH